MRKGRWLLGILSPIVLTCLFIVTRGALLVANEPPPPAGCVRSSCDRASGGGGKYSGTNCTIKGAWVAGTGQKLTKVELWVNDVRRYVMEWSPPTKTSWCATAPFSSTQFGHNTTMTLKSKCWNDAGKSREATDEKTAWNRGYVLYNQNGNYTDDAATDADTELGYMNHGTSGAVGDHTATNIKNNIPNYGVFFIATHGDPSWFADCFFTGQPPNDKVVTANDVATAVANKDAGQCPYVFVFLLACYCASTEDTFLDAFAAKALLGWEGTPYDNSTYEEWCFTVWYALAPPHKMTVYWARDYAHDQVQGVTDDVIRGDASRRLYLEYPSV
jgi:hypothetical protein